MSRAFAREARVPAPTTAREQRVSTHGDRHEREAELAADAVLRGDHAFSLSQLGGGEGDPVQRERASGASSATVAARDLGGGEALDAGTRSAMEAGLGHDFSRVRVHTDARADEAVRGMHALAYTTGTDIAFAAGRFAPDTPRGRHLLAHELAHVAQQQRGSGAQRVADSGDVSPAMVQRSLTEAQLSTTPDSAIRQDPDYLDNRMVRIEFYGAELAVIHYEGGAQLRLGLVPDQIQPPVVGVDYRTPRSEHLSLRSPGPGQTRFLPRARQVHAPNLTAEQVTQELGRTIMYAIDPASKRIVPTEVNDITAPRLCDTLRRAEAEYVRRTNEIASGAVKIFEKFEIILLLASLIPTGGESAAAAGARGAGTAGAVEVGAAGRAIAALRPFFLRLLRSGATEAITVEGVGFGGVRVFMSEGRVLTVLRNTIVNAERVPAQGRLIHSAFEQAAVAAAREAGATSVRVGLETIVNPKWATYLESLGYGVELLPHANGIGFSRVLMRTLSL